MKASEAARIATSYNNDNIKKELEKVYKQIKESAEKGNRTMHFSVLSSKAIKHLEENGYKTKAIHDPRPGESCTKVEW